MITSPTVFITGAGASWEYGFPLGRELVRQIVQGTAKGGDLRAELLRTDYIREGDIDAFSERLRGSDPRSIDTFLEGNQPEMVEIGKAAIALLILRAEHQCKREGRLFIGSELLQDHWLGYVWDLMRSGSTPENFANNQISFVTFNYDRLIEYYFETVLQHTFGIRHEAAKTLQQSLRIVHLHGELGTPIFGQYQNQLQGLLVREAAKGILVIHDQFATDDPNFRRARELLEPASIVCMLGFGYHPVNIERLKLGRYTVDANKQVAGSTYLMGGAQVRVAQKRLQRAFPSHPGLKAEQFLKEAVELV